MKAFLFSVAALSSAVVLSLPTSDQVDLTGDLSSNIIASNIIAPNNPTVQLFKRKKSSKYSYKSSKYSNKSSKYSGKKSKSNNAHPKAPGYPTYPAAPQCNAVTATVNQVQTVTATATFTQVNTVTAIATETKYITI